jgi:hypothetical protein
MKKLTVFIMTIVFLAFMGLGVSATSDEPKPVDGTDPILTDPSAQPADGTVINPCGENVEVCIFSSGEGTATDGKVCSIDSKGVESCEAVTVGAPDEGVVNGSEGGEVAPDCQKDPTVCQRADDGVIYTMAPADGKYEDGIYYMNGDKDTGVAKDTTMVTISVVASTLGLILLGIAANRKFKKN